MELIVVGVIGVAWCISTLVLMDISYRAGIAAGYGATKWPDSVHFVKARRIINGWRRDYDLPPIEKI